MYNVMKLILLGMIFTTIHATASSKTIWTCLQPAGTIKYPGSIETLFYKVKVLQSADGKLKGTYTKSAKRQMNTSSISLKSDGENIYTEEKPSASLKKFSIEITEEKALVHVDVSKSVDEEKIYSSGTISGYKSIFSATEFADGKNIEVETSDLICDTSDSNLFKKD